MRFVDIHIYFQYDISQPIIISYITYSPLYLYSSARYDNILLDSYLRVSPACSICIVCPGYVRPLESLNPI